ncbi:CCHC-type domain-containing protein [Trichonephila inaurata madagascariensis]|uniref:CCHC-type domain-containing protein n=1 Tax=Trichonephila inaurata madagascariensis TaxID=2747483 RepID=A0A8X6WP82_9ARAC|nr:CCHC-type domain-containing protein [Trichonephila inaurata madagascariensis]
MIASSSSSNVSANQACTSEVLLQTLVVMLKNGNHKSLVRALIDTRSQKSYILKSPAEKLGFKYEGEEFVHSLFDGSKTKMYRHKCYKICLTDIDNYYTCNLNVYDQEIIRNDVPSIRHNPQIKELKNRKINLSDSGHNLGGKIEILLGADVAGKLLTGTMFYLKSGSVAIKTKLGWMLMGKTYRNVRLTHFNLRGWQSNILLNPEKFSELESQPDNFETMVLGLIWNLKDDYLTCNINCQKNEGKAITKRSLLSTANHIFDWIGFTTPVTLKPKLKWDENLQVILNLVKKWKRFRIEYLGQLREKTQHHWRSRPLTVGDVVVVENSLKNRTLWSLARVIQLIPGKDGHVRVARVKTETGELVRPVQRLYNLELQEPEINLPKEQTDSAICTRRGRKVTSPKHLTYA